MSAVCRCTGPVTCGQSAALSRLILSTQESIAHGTIQQGMNAMPRSTIKMFFSLPATAQLQPSFLFTDRRKP